MFSNRYNGRNNIVGVGMRKLIGIMKTFGVTYEELMRLSEE